MILMQETLLRVCCAMLILLRRRLLAGDFTSNLKLLQNYPPPNISHLLYVANKLRGTLTGWAEPLIRPSPPRRVCNLFVKMVFLNNFPFAAWIGNRRNTIMGVSFNCCPTWFLVDLVCLCPISGASSRSKSGWRWCHAIDLKVNVLKVFGVSLLIPVCFFYFFTRSGFLDSWVNVAHGQRVDKNGAKLLTRRSTF